MSNFNKTFYLFWLLVFIHACLVSCVRTPLHEDTPSSIEQKNTITEYTIIENLKWDADTNLFWGYIRLEQNPTTGDLTGNHQFVRKDGNRIDFCEENSINLAFIKDSLWKGQMADCYDHLTNEITMRIASSNRICFQIEGNMHEFLPDTFSLYILDSTAN